MMREFKVVTIDLDELDKIARAREDDLNEWSLCKLHVNELTGNLEMMFWTTNEKLVKAEAAKKQEILMKRKEELEIEILRLKNSLEPISITLPKEELEELKEKLND